MHVFADDFQELSGWIRKEVVFERDTGRGSRGRRAVQAQEWLNLHGFGLAVDGAFGRITERMVKRFQEHQGFDPTGIVDPITHDALVEPMVSVLRQRLDMSVPIEEAILDYAEAHLAVHPREVGGQNRGPWVRLYMKGHDGRQFPWCAGFVTFLLHQACQSLEIDRPIRGSGSCDSLAAQAKEAGLFVQERDAGPDTLPAGSIFLVRRTSTDWTHTGLVSFADDEGFDTIEGNTNDDGSREGYEVCARRRAYSKKNFIRLST